MAQYVPGYSSARVGFPATSLVRVSEAIGRRMDGTIVHDTILLAKDALYAAVPTVVDLRRLIEINQDNLERIGVCVTMNEKHSADSSRDTVWPGVEAAPTISGAASPIEGEP